MSDEKNLDESAVFALSPTDGRFHLHSTNYDKASNYPFQRHDRARTF